MCTISIVSSWSRGWRIAAAAPARTRSENGTSNGPVIDADHDVLKALERWVEQGVAPDKIIATHYVNNTPPAIQFQRPLCPYPQRGDYIGTGDPNQASSFKCVEHEDESDPRNRGVQAAYE
jgi:tannase/feruloyl esterase